MKRTPKVGDHVSFEGKPYVYIVESEELIECDKPCDIPHDEGDCLDEPYVRVKQETFLALPLSKLQYIYNPVTHIGKKV